MHWTGTPGSGLHYATIFLFKAGAQVARVDLDPWTGSANTFTYNGGVVVADQIIVAVLCSSGAVYDGDCTIDWVQIGGSGSNPLGSDNCP
jgi:hypothetical protein